MEAAGLAFGVAGAAELCLKMFKELAAKCESYKSADLNVKHSIISLQTHERLLQESINIVTDDIDKLSPTLQSHFNMLFLVLQEKLGQASTHLDRVGDLRNEKDPSSFSLHKALGKRSKVRYTFSLEESLNKMLKDLKSWQEMLFMAMTLLVKSPRSLNLDAKQGAGGTFDTTFLKALRQMHNDQAAGVASSDTGLITAQSISSTGRDIPIVHSSAVVTYDKEKNLLFVKDQVRLIPGIRLPRFLVSLNQLAAKLSKVARDTSGILECRGAIDGAEVASTYEDKHVSLIFQLPAWASRKVKNLRTALIDGGETVALNTRLDIAEQLARSVVFLHAAKFVHKNIRPEAILLLRQSNTSSNVLGRPYLIGFEQLRSVDAVSMLSGDDIWYRNIYRHPSRQGLLPQEQYTMQHDIYSLGVCLLELGLWETFVEWPPARKSVQYIGSGLLLAEKLKSAVKHVINDIFVKVKDESTSRSTQEGNPKFILTSSQKRASALKDVFVALTDEILPSRMGMKYASVVKACLTCLDVDNDDFGELGDYQDDDDGTMIGTRYLENVILQLQEISV